MIKDKMRYVAAFLLVTTIIPSSLAVYYYNKYGETEEKYRRMVEDLDDLTIQVSIKIDYGNGTVLWHNNTRVPLNASLLSATSFIADITYTRGEYGAFVNSINDVSNKDGKYWLWSYFDGETQEWKMGTVAADMRDLHEGDIVAWIYTKT